LKSALSTAKQGYMRRFKIDGAIIKYSLVNKSILPRIQRIRAFCKRAS
jgi:hypothetical protein